MSDPYTEIESEEVSEEFAKLLGVEELNEDHRKTVKAAMMLDKLDSKVSGCVLLNAIGMSFVNWLIEHCSGECSGECPDGEQEGQGITEERDPFHPDFHPRDGGEGDSAESDD